jgi:hypothetical protein
VFFPFLKCVYTFWHSLYIYVGTKLIVPQLLVFLGGVIKLEPEGEIRHPAEHSRNHLVKLWNRSVDALTTLYERVKSKIQLLELTALRN